MCGDQKIVQYIVLREDLQKKLKWPLGAVIAQACHACMGIVTSNMMDDCVKRYLKDMDRMHKVVVGIESEDSLKNLSQELEKSGISHMLWIEQPENVPTCIATKPEYVSIVQPHFKGLKLLRHC